MASITDYLNFEIYAGITVSHVIAAVVLILVISFVWKKLKKKDRPDVYEKVRCKKCGWTGEVSKYHKVCRNCGGTELLNMPQ